MTWYLLKDTSGNKSVSYTMLVYTFIVCTSWMALSTFNKIHLLEIREFDATGASVWFAPIAALYFSRRWKSKDDLLNSLKETTDAAKENAKKSQKISEQ